MNRNAGKKVILDSCFIIRYLKNGTSSIEGQVIRKLDAEGATKCITKGISREVSRWVELQFPMDGFGGKWAALACELSTLNPNLGNVIWEAGHIFTHYPDNLHIATAKLENSSLVSYDQAMIKVAKDEGLSAYLPQELLVTS